MAKPTINGRQGHAVMDEVTFFEPARRSGKTNAARVKLYRSVHAACRAAGLDEDDRKAMQSEMFGKASLSDMTPTEIGQMLDRLNKDRRPARSAPHISKIRALWWSLYWLGEVSSTSDRTINTFVERQTGISALRFLDVRKGRLVIEALKSWLARVGVVWPTAEEIADHRGQIAQMERVAVFAVLHGKLLTAGIWDGNVWHEFAGSVPFTAWFHGRSITELDAAIRHFGQMLRDSRA